MTAIDLSKQQALDAGPRAVQQNNFTGNLDSRKCNGFHYWRSKRNSLRLFSRNCKSIKSATKNETEVVLRLSSNMIGNSNDEIWFPTWIIIN